MEIGHYMLLQLQNGQKWQPKFGKSNRYQHWVSISDGRRCLDCEELQGKIWRLEEKPIPEPPLHFNCRCVIEIMQTIEAGTATADGIDGADWALKYEEQLPDCYISKTEAWTKNWRPGKWPSNFIPGKMLTDNYENKDSHLPAAPGRQWYEADINYRTGKRNTQRVLWSNDGLLFVTFDHYATFYEIV